MKRGFTLVELLVVMGMTLVLVGGMSAAYYQAVRYATNTPLRLEEYQERGKLEERLKTLFEQAYLTGIADDTLTYFTTNTAGGIAADTDTLTFTTLGVLPEGGFLGLRDERTQEELNEVYGPQGGVAEVSFSTVPVGEAAQGEGLFLRIQRPSDGDPSQGGRETLLIPNATGVYFEFFDGLDWIAEWDTRAGQARLPASVRLVYQLPDEAVQRILTFRIIGSDITPTNPLTESTGAQ